MAARRQQRDVNVMTKTLLATALAAITLSGCTLAPRYERPAAPVAGQYPSGEAYGAPAQTQIAPADLGWRDFFQDAYLQSLIETALGNNRDLRVAILNIEAARAQYRIQRSALLPTIDGIANQTAQGLPPALSQTGERSVSRQYNVGVGITAFELDLFGRLQSLKDQQLELYLATAQSRRSAQISLIAEVANTYLTLLADRELLQVTRDTLQNQQAAFDLIKRRFEEGVASEVDMHQAQTSVEIARSNLALYTRQLAQDQNALVLLLGAPLPAGLPDIALSAQPPLSDLPAGLPSELLQRRPDILAAEHALRASNANIGAARAAFFPSISLTASTGTASPTLAGLFDANTSAWSFTPQLSLPLFHGGANIANLDLAHALKNIDVARYEKTVQTAFRETADALAARGTLDDETAAQQRLVDASAASYRLADLRYRNGVDSYLNALVSQRSLYSAQQSLIVTRLAQMSNRVTLYKVLGGGWVERNGEMPKPADAGAREQVVR